MLGWPDVDRSAERIVLKREHSKNGEPRILPLLGEPAALIERRWVAREYETAEGSSALSPFVFHRDGFSGTLFYDLQRSAVRNMDRAGVSQTVAMALTAAIESSTRTTCERRWRRRRRVWQRARPAL